MTMDGMPRESHHGPTGPAPITEADLHAYVDRQLAPDRRAEVEMFLSTRPEDLERVRHWQQQNEAMRGLLDPVLEEPLPLRLPLHGQRPPWSWRGLAASVLLAAASAVLAWSWRGAVDAESVRQASTAAPRALVAAEGGGLTGFAHQAAVAHAVYSPDVRRPVEVGADQEQALVTWLTKRMGTPVHAPKLGPLGYDLIGGRLLPGDQGPVAQFMYGASGGQRLTLYVTHDATVQDTAFQFGRDGSVNVFYWVEGRFGYAISAGADRDELLKVSQEVYRQLKPG